ncbi:MAG: hypothetical protein P8163_08545 [Candidatus Thiodiazotropha sp.]
MVNKKVNYHELLYRVLWLETNTTSLDISGLWNPDVELTVTVNDELLNGGINAYELFSIVNDKDILESYKHGLANDYAQHYSGIHPKMPHVNLPPKADYLAEYPTYDGFEELSSKLVDSGVNYLFEYLAPDVYGKAAGLGLVIVKMPSQLRVIDLLNKKVIWFDPDANAIEGFQLGGDFHALEVNNLALLKQGIINGMKTRVLTRQYLANEFEVEIDDVYQKQGKADNVLSELAE